LEIETARIFVPLLKPARYKGAKGGRGSGKSHFFAGLAVESCLLNPATRGLCIREKQTSLRQSAKQLIEDKIRAHDLTSLFNITSTEIRTPGGGVITFAGMQDHTAESVKSFEGYDWAWVEEAQTLSQHSLDLLRPTIRKEGSELWFSWNPRRKNDPVDMLFSADELPPEAVLVRANWNHNPWFPATLEKERAFDQENFPEKYDHIWGGDYAGIVTGAYYAKELAAAYREGRICKLTPDPLMEFQAFFDIGGAGNQGDATSIWIRQVVGQTINVLDYYEAQGQPLGAHLNWLRDNGYANCRCILPHDGVVTNGITAKRYEDHVREAGFRVDVVKNQGRGAALRRVEATRRIFPRVWFNQDTTLPGREALGWYHEKLDPVRRIGLGPDHDWSSHAADAFGLMAVFGAQIPMKSKPMRFETGMPAAQH
jgi:phage terminase large subunit